MRRTTNPLLQMGVWARENMFRKSCGTKEQFFTEKDCTIRINTLIQKFNEPGLVPYKCPFCGWWHYGHEIGLEKKVEEVAE